VNKFFDSEVVAAAMVELADMQEELLVKMFTSPMETKETRVAYINLMKEFLEKQKLFFFRLTLSDDEEAKEVKELIIKQAKILGIIEEDNTEDLFKSLEKTITELAKLITLD